MTKDELLLRILDVRPSVPQGVIEELKKCDTVDEIVATLPEAIGKEIVTRLGREAENGSRSI